MANSKAKFFRNTPAGPVKAVDHKEHLRGLIRRGVVAPKPGAGEGKDGGWRMESGKERMEGGKLRLEKQGRRVKEKEKVPKLWTKTKAKTRASTSEPKPQRSTLKPQNQGPAKVAPLSNLPLSPQQLESAQKAPISSALRWLAVWVKRAIEKVTPDQFRGKKRASLTMTFFEVTVPSQNEIEIAAAESFFAALASLYKPGPFSFAPSLFNPSPVISLEIVADHADIRFVVGCPAGLADFVEKQLHGAYPVAQIDAIAEYDPFDPLPGQQGEEERYYASFAELGTSGPAYYPIRTYEEIKVDPLSTILAPFSRLGEGESAVLQLILQPAGDRWRKRGSQFLKSAQTPKGGGKNGAAPKINVDPEVIKSVQGKTSKVALNCVLRVVTVARTKQTADAYLQNIVASFEQFSYPHLARFKKQKIRFKKHFMVDFVYRYFAPFWRHNTVLNTEELATVWHLPGKEVQTPHIKWLLSKFAPAPTTLPKFNPDHLYLGVSKFRGVEKKVYLPRDDRRRHLYVLGQTGTGKSQFMKHLAYQDIARGEGLAFIDPHGSEAEDLLKMIPLARVEDVIYFNPADIERPMGLNILEAGNEQAKHMAVNAFIALLYKLYDPGHTGIMGPRLERAIRNVMLTAMSEPGNSMIEVYRLLTDPKFAKEKMPLVQDPIVKSYWKDELAQTSEFHKSEVLGYFVSKFDRFVTEILMRNIIGQGQSSFNFRDIMDQKKILIVNLAKGLIGEENSNFLGLLLVPRILMAAMSRQELIEKGQSEFPDFYLYVDEFQNFSTPDFAQILSEARKYRLNLSVANQFIGQLEEKIKDAVFGNVGSLASFRIGTDDAAYLEKQFEPVFDQGDLQNLPVGAAYVRLLIKGQPTPPFSMRTDWDEIQNLPRSETTAQAVKELSRLKYGRDRKVVESEIKTRANLG